MEHVCLTTHNCDKFKLVKRKIKHLTMELGRYITNLDKINKHVKK